MKNETIVLIVLEDEKEKQRIDETLSNYSKDYKLLFPTSLASFDKLINTYNIE